MKKWVPAAAAVAVCLGSGADGTGFKSSFFPLYFRFLAPFSEKFLSISAKSIALEKVIQLPDQ